jgi:hypothetical protein
MVLPSSTLCMAATRLARHLYAFDLLERGRTCGPGHSVNRKARPARLLARPPAGIVYNEHTEERASSPRSPRLEPSNWYRRNDFPVQFCDARVCALVRRVAKVAQTAGSRLNLHPRFSHKPR